MAEAQKAEIVRLRSDRKALSSRVTEILLGSCVGAVGGALQGPLLSAPLAQSLLCGLLFGAAFALLFAKRATSPGAGLIWGLAFAVLMWLLFPAGIVPLAAGAAGSGSMLQDARARFPQLVSFLLCLGMPAGLTLGLWAELRGTASNPKFNWGRATVAGGFAGTLGGLIFGRWVSSGDYFPLLAGYGTLTFSHGTIIFLHFSVALLIGITFGLLFQRDVLGYGSCMGWGLGYAMFWWFLGQLTLLPLVAHKPIDWSTDQASFVFGSLVGHILYGLILGVTYATLDRFWVRLFIKSDPLNREVGGVGVHV